MSVPFFSPFRPSRAPAPPRPARRMPGAPDPALLNATIELHLNRLRSELQSVSCDGGCSDWFIRTHVAEWRSSAFAAERARLFAHAALFGEFLPSSTLNQSQIQHTKLPTTSYTGRFSPFDYWEAEYSCASESRVPANVVGDGAKWLCGAALHPAPCQVVSLGSNFDDAFERGMHKLANCKSYIVDPTLRVLQSSPNELLHFQRQLKSYGASLNTSVGVGRAGEKLRFRGLKAPLVSLETLLRDRFLGAPSAHVSVLKADIEGAEYDSLDDLWNLCASGWLTVDQVNIEVHLAQRPMREMHAVFAGARKCGLVLHHKEVNTWGRYPCVEFSWVSLAHAQRAAAAAVGAQRRPAMRESAELLIGPQSPSSTPVCPQSLLDRLATPAALRDSFVFINGALNMDLKTDKFGEPRKLAQRGGARSTGHSYEGMYSHYIGDFVRRRCAALHIDPAPRVRFLEIGLGCGMEDLGLKPGGGVEVWRALFPPPFVLELYVFELAEKCARQWEREQPSVTGMATKVLIGDQTSSSDLDRAYAEAGGEPFDFVVDDGSHVSGHQVASLTHMARSAYLRSKGIYIVEDIQGSCRSWPVMGRDADGQKLGGNINSNRTRTGLWVDGTSGCLLTADRRPTLLGQILAWQKKLASGSIRSNLSLPVSHIDVSREAAVFEMV